MLLDAITANIKTIDNNIITQTNLLKNDIKKVFGRFENDKLTDNFCTNMYKYLAPIDKQILDVLNSLHAIQKNISIEQNKYSYRYFCFR